MKYKLPVFLFPLVINIFLAVMLFGCAVDETARVTINLGLDAHARHEERSVFDRVLAFLSFAGEARAQAAPAKITGIELYVSGPGMAEERHLFSPSTTKISVIAPAGNKRTFLVIARIDPSDPRAVLAYGGSATVSLKGGDDITLNIQMKTYETKLVIPDYNNTRVVQIDDMSGAGWSVFETGSNYPSDVTVDGQGRIC
ncbi:MAG TPA: hypothetical protein ENN21_05570, partial [Spirochaetes bacterium]|nr:hypothetical protein [Spirochaetota bacterium]